MTMVMTTNSTRVLNLLNTERANLGQPPIGEGALETSASSGDFFLVDLADTGQPRGSVAWISATPDWAHATQLAAHQIWGPSARHLQILVDVCAWGVSQDSVPRWSFLPRLLASMPIVYGNDGHAMTVIANNLLIPAGAATLLNGGRQTRTTLRAALPILQAALP